MRPLELRGLPVGRLQLLASLLSLVLGSVGMLIAVPVTQKLLTASSLGQGEKTVRIMAENSRAGYKISPPSSWLEAWRPEPSCCTGLASSKSETYTLRIDEGARPIQALLVGPDFMDAFSISPVAGRAFTVDSYEKSTPVVMVTAGFARLQLGGPSEALGESLVLDGSSRMVVGVLPNSFAQRLYPAQVFDLAIPMSPDRHRSVDIFATLAKQVDTGRAQAELLSRVQENLQLGESAGRAHPAIVPANELIDSKGRVLIRSSIVAGLILLVVTLSSITHLLVAGIEARSKQLATRWALGESRVRLIGSWLAVSVVLGASAASLALVLAMKAISFSRSTLPPSLLWLAEIDFGFNAWCITILVNVTVLSLLGALSIHKTGSAGWASLLRTHHHQPSPKLGGRLVANVNLLSMAAISTPLLVGSLLVWDAINHSSAVRNQFNTQGLYFLNVKLPDWKFQEPASRTAVFEDLADQAESIPGVSEVAISSIAPFESSFYFAPINLSGPGIEVEALSSIRVASVSPGYFSTLGQPMVAGRSFEAAASLSGSGMSSPVIIVSEAVARYMAVTPQRALGKLVRIGANTVQIVGVVRDETFQGGHLARKIYAPITQYSHQAYLLIRAPANFEESLRSLARTIDRDVIATAVPMSSLLRRSQADIRFLASLFSCVTLLSILVAVMAIFSVQNGYAIRRRQELALRTALGAQRWALARRFIGKSMVTSLVGSLAGLFVSFPFARTLAAQLEGLDPDNLASRVAAVGLVCAFTLAASSYPAYRATKIDLLRLLNEG